VFAIGFAIATLHVPQRGPEYVVYYSTATFFSQALHCFVPVLMWLFFRRKAVREAMMNVAGQG
jgi:hypothetical protein